MDLFPRNPCRNLLRDFHRRLLSVVAFSVAVSGASIGALTSAAAAQPVVNAGPDRRVTARPPLQLQGSVGKLSPLDFLVADGDNATEDMLVKYLERPVESTVLIFIADDIDKRKKLAKSLMAGAAFEFQPLKADELKAWIKSHLKKLGVEIEPRAGHLILEMVRSDLNTLTNELNKLAAASLPSGRITTALVDQ